MKLHIPRARSSKSIPKSTHRQLAKWKSIIDYEDKSSEKPITDLWIPPRKDERKDDRPRAEIIGDKASREEAKPKGKKQERGICVITNEEPDPCSVDFSVDFSV